MEIDSAIKLVNHYLRESENEMNSFGSGLPDYVNPEIELQIITSSDVSFANKLCVNYAV